MATGFDLEEFMQERGLAPTPAQAEAAPDLRTATDSQEFDLDAFMQERGLSEPTPAPPPAPAPLRAQPIARPEEDSGFDLDEFVRERGLSTPSPEPEPQSLQQPQQGPLDLPDDVLGDVPEERRPQATEAFRAASRRYQKLKDPGEKVEVLEAWMEEYLPAEAKRAREEADPGGSLFKLLDTVDKYADRPPRALINATWRARKHYLETGNYATPAETAAFLKEEFDRDSGEIEDGRIALKSAYSWLHSVLGLPVANANNMTGEEFLKHIEEKGEERFQAFESTFDKSGIAKPLTGGLYFGLAVGSQILPGGNDYGGVMEARKEAMLGHRFVTGEQLTGFTGLALISPLDMLGGGVPKAAFKVKSTQFGVDSAKRMLAGANDALLAFAEENGAALTKATGELRTAYEAGEMFATDAAKVMGTVAEDPKLAPLVDLSRSRFADESSDILSRRVEAEAQGLDVSGLDEAYKTAEGRYLAEVEELSAAFIDRTADRIGEFVHIDVEAKWLDAQQVALRQDVTVYGTDAIGVLNNLKNVKFTGAFEAAAEAAGVTTDELLAGLKGVTAEDAVLTEALIAMGAKGADLTATEKKAEALWAHLMRKSKEDRMLLKDVKITPSGEVNRFGRPIVRPDDVKITWQTPAEAIEEVIRSGGQMPSKGLLEGAMKAPQEGILKVAAALSGVGDDFAAFTKFDEFRLSSHLDAFGTKLAHSVFSKTPHFMEAIANNLWNIGNPQKAARFFHGDKGAKRLVAREHIQHPALFAKAEARTKTKLIQRGADRERLGGFVQRIMAITEDDSVLRQAVIYRELGYTDELTEQQIVALANIRRVELIFAEAMGGKVGDELVPPKDLREISSGKAADGTRTGPGISEIDDPESAALIRELRQALQEASGGGGRGMPVSRDTASPGEDTLMGSQSMVTATIEEFIAQMEKGGGKEIRKKLLDRAQRHLKVIRSGIQESLASEYKLNRIMDGWVEAAPLIKEGEELRALRKAMMDVSRTGKWDGEASLDEAIDKINEMRRMYGDASGRVYAELGRLRNGLPPGDKSTWAQHRTNLRSSLVERFPEEQIDELIMPLFDLRAASWASWHGVDPANKDAWYGVNLRRIDVEDLYDTWDARVENRNPSATHNTELDPKRSAALHSVLEDRLEGFSKPRATLAEFRGFLTKNGVKAEELEDTALFAGLEEFRVVEETGKTKPKLYTKEEMIEEFRNGQRPWTETVKTDTPVGGNAVLIRAAEEAHEEASAASDAARNAALDGFNSKYGVDHDIVREDGGWMLLRFNEEAATDVVDDFDMPDELYALWDGFRDSAAKTHRTGVKVTQARGVKTSATEEAVALLGRLPFASETGGVEYKLALTEPGDRLHTIGRGDGVDAFVVQTEHRGDVFEEYVYPADAEAYRALDEYLGVRDFIEFPRPLGETSRSQNAWTRESDPSGGRDYTERVYTLDDLRPGEEAFSTQHFVTEENAFLHIRYDFVDEADGTKTLRLIEVQSDLHQRARSSGYAGVEPSEAESLSRVSKAVQNSDLPDAVKESWANSAKLGGGARAVLVDVGRLNPFHKRKINRLIDEVEAVESLPSAPFKKSWKAFALKQAVKAATEAGADRVTWQSGDSVVAARGAGKGIARTTYDQDLPRAAKNLYKRFKATPKKVFDSASPRLPKMSPGDWVVVHSDGNVYKVLKTEDEAGQVANRLRLGAHKLHKYDVVSAESLIEKRKVAAFELPITPELRASVTDQGQALYSREASLEGLPEGWLGSGREVDPGSLSAEGWLEVFGPGTTFDLSNEHGSTKLVRMSDGAVRPSNFSIPLAREARRTGVGTKLARDVEAGAGGRFPDMTTMRVFAPSDEVAEFWVAQGYTPKNFDGPMGSTVLEKEVLGVEAKAAEDALTKPDFKAVQADYIKAGDEFEAMVPEFKALLKEIDPHSKEMEKVTEKGRSAVRSKERRIEDARTSRARLAALERAKKARHGLTLEAAGEVGGLSMARGADEGALSMVGGGAPASTPVSGAVKAKVEPRLTAEEVEIRKIEDLEIERAKSDLAEAELLVSDGVPKDLVERISSYRERRLALQKVVWKARETIQGRAQGALGTERLVFVYPSDQTARVRVGKPGEWPEKLTPEEVAAEVKKFTDLGGVASDGYDGAVSIDFKLKDIVPDSDIQKMLHARDLNDRISYPTMNPEGRRADKIHGSTIPYKDRIQFARNKNLQVRGVHQTWEGLAQATIGIFEAGDLTTLVHEMGHLFRRDLPPEDMATITRWVNRNPKMKKYGKVVVDTARGGWRGVGKGGRRSSVAESIAEEMFAQGFVQYLKSSRAPVPGLKKAFQMAKEWLRDTFKAVAGGLGIANPVIVDVKLGRGAKEAMSHLFTQVESPKVKARNIEEARIHKKVSDHAAAIRTWEGERDKAVAKQDDVTARLGMAKSGIARAKSSKNPGLVRKRLSETAGQVADDVMRSYPEFANEAKEVMARAYMMSHRHPPVVGGTWLDGLMGLKSDEAFVKAFQAGKMGEAMALIGKTADSLRIGGDKVQKVVDETLDHVYKLEDDINSGAIGSPVKPVADADVAAYLAKQEPDYEAPKASAEVKRRAKEVAPWLGEQIKRHDAEVQRTLKASAARGEAMAVAQASDETAALIKEALDSQDLGKLNEAIAKASELAPGRQVKPRKSPGQFKKEPQIVDRDQPKKVTSDMLDDPDIVADLEKMMDDLGWDLTTPAEMKKRLKNHRNEASATKAIWEKTRSATLKRWKDHHTARNYSTLTKVQQSMVERALKNPRMYRMPEGIDEGVKASARKMGLLSRAGETIDKEALEVAVILDEFFEGYLKRLQLEKGALTDFDKQEMLSRLDVAAYVPHILTSMAKDKVQALKNGGVLPREFDPMFLEHRGIKGSIQAVNARMLRQLAEDSIRAQIIHGQLDVSQASKMGMTVDELMESANRRSLSRDVPEDIWEALIKQESVSLNQNGTFEYFATDPLVIMEHYATQVDKSIADAIYLRDMDDMFPLGKKFSDAIAMATSKLDEIGEEAVAAHIANVEFAAERAGYAKLSHTDYLSTLLNLKLPAGLRKHGEYIKAQLAANVSPQEITRVLREQGFTVDTGWVASYRVPPKYYPVQTVDYIKMINTPDVGGAGIEILDGIQSWAKGMATISSLAHISMNAMGNVLSVLQVATFKDILNPVNVLTAMKIFVRHPAGSPKLDELVTLGNKTMSVKRWRQQFELGGALEVPGQSAFREEMLGRSMTTPLTSTPSSTGAKVGGAALGAGIGGTLGGLAGGPVGAAAGAFLGQYPGAALGEAIGRGVGIKAVVSDDINKFLAAISEVKNKEDYKPIGKGGEVKRFRPGGKAVKRSIQYAGEHVTGAAVGGVIGSVAGPAGAAFGAAVGGLTFPAYLRMMSDLNSAVEQMSRATVAVARLQAGDTFQEAMLQTDRALRNYSYITPLERKTLRRVLFFHTWEAGNMRFQLEQLVKNPWQAKRTQSFLHGLYMKDFDEDELEAMPEWLRWQVVMRTGVAKVMTVRGVPQTAALEFASKWDSNKPTGLLQRVRPDLLTLFEYGFGRESTFYGKGWDELTNVRMLKNAPPLLKAVVGVPDLSNADEADQPRSVPVWKDGKRAGTKLDYRTHHPRQYYLMQKAPGWRVLREYMNLVTDTFQSRALDAGDMDAKASSQDKLLAFAIGFKPQFIDWEAQEMYMRKELEAALLHQLENWDKNATMTFTKLGKDLDYRGNLLNPDDRKDMEERDRLEELGLE
jgi:hypothetical protein